MPFCFFAFLLWPVWVPFAIRKSETEPHHQKQQAVWFVLGSIVTAFLLLAMVSSPLLVQVSCAHINYDIQFPGLIWIAYAYVFVIIGSFVSSSRARLRWFGLLMCVSAAFSIWSAAENFTSVWCSFAAILSALLVWCISPKSEKILSQCFILSV